MSYDENRISDLIDRGLKNKEGVYDNLHIGQMLYICYCDSLRQKKIEAISSEKEGISGRLNWTGNDGRPTYFKIINGVISGKYNYSYNRDEVFIAFINKGEAAEYLRKKILKMNDSLRDNVQSKMDELKQFRVKHFELLNSTDVDEWIKNFEREYHW